MPFIQCDKGDQIESPKHELKKLAISVVSLCFRMNLLFPYARDVSLALQRWKAGLLQG